MAVWVSESEPAVEWYGNSLVGVKSGEECTPYARLLFACRDSHYPPIHTLRTRPGYGPGYPLISHSLFSQG